MPLFNDNSSLIVPPHPGFVSGKYYAPAIYPSNSNANFSVGFIYYTYFFIPFQQAFNKIGFVSQTGFTPTEFARIAVYKIVSGLPSNLIADLGEISFTTSGLKEFSCSLNLSPGWYAIAMTFSPNSINLTIITGALSSVIGTINPAVGITFSGLRSTSAYGAFPSSAPLVAVIETNTPLPWLKAA